MKAGWEKALRAWPSEAVWGGGDLFLETDFQRGASAITALRHLRIYPHIHTALHLSE